MLTLLESPDTNETNTSQFHVLNQIFNVDSIKCLLRGETGVFFVLFFLLILCFEFIKLKFYSTSKFLHVILVTKIRLVLGKTKCFWISRQQEITNLKKPTLKALGSKLWLQHHLQDSKVLYVCPLVIEAFVRMSLNVLLLLGHFAACSR